MKFILVLALTFLSSTTSFAETQAGKDFCMKFASESVAKTFNKKNFSDSQQRNYYNEETYKRYIDDYIEKIGSQATASMKKLCESKGENVTIEEMSYDLSLECRSACGRGRLLFKKPSSGEVGFETRVNTYLAYCTDLCMVSRNELENMLIGARMQAKNQAPDCSGSVADSSRTKYKSITSDLDKIDATKKTTGK